MRGGDVGGDEHGVFQAHLAQGAVNDPAGSDQHQPSPGGTELLLQPDQESNARAINKADPVEGKEAMLGVRDGGLEQRRVLAERQQVEASRELEESGGRPYG